MKEKNTSYTKCLLHMQKKINADHRKYQKVRDDLPIIPENIEELRMIFAI